MWAQTRKVMTHGTNLPLPAGLVQAGPGVFGGSSGSGEHPKVAAVRASARERLAKQEEAEAKAKEALVKSAAGYLETFYQARHCHLPSTR